MRNIRFKFLSILIVSIFIVLSVFLSEYFLRYLGLGDPIIYKTNPAWKYSLSENQKKIRFEDKEIIINNVGLRSSKQWIKQDNKLILFVGDSVTYGGSRIDNKELFSERICKSLKGEYICGNAGTNGYGVLNMIMRSRYDDRIQNADVVIFVLILQDFWRGLVDMRQLGFFTSRPNSFFPAIEEAINHFGWKYDINRYLGQKDKINSSVKSSDRKKLIYKLRQDEANFAIENLNKEILRLTSQNKKVFVFFSPSRHSLIEKEIDWEKRLKDKIVKNVDNIYDLTNDFRNNKELEIFMDDVHLNIKGHKVASDLILNRLKNKLK